MTTSKEQLNKQLKVLKRIMKQTENQLMMRRAIYGKTSSRNAMGELEGKASIIRQKIKEFESLYND